MTDSLNRTSSVALGVTSKPLAAPGLISYRCKGKFGWIMIGATDHDDAIVQAKRSSSDLQPNSLEVWNGSAYVSCTTLSTKGAALEVTSRSLTDVKSISDDDLCATCSNCQYQAGELSGCSQGWPGTSDADGYMQECTSFTFAQ